MPKIVVENRVVRLTDTQLIALSSAAQRGDGAIVIPDRIKGKSALKLAGKLIENGLAREVRAEPGMPVYRHDDEGVAFALVITEAGKFAINIADAPQEPCDSSAPAGKEEINESTHPAVSEGLNPPQEAIGASASALVSEPPGAVSMAAQIGAEDARGVEAQNAAVMISSRTPPRAGTKIAEVIALLARSEGAKIDDIIAATGWLHGLDSNPIIIPWTPQTFRRKREVIQPSSDAANGARPIRAEARTKLLFAISKARRWLDEIVSEKGPDIEAIAAREGISERSARMGLSLAFLAPDIVRAAVDGTLARGFGVTRLMDMPSSWSDQRRAIGIAATR